MNTPTTIDLIRHGEPVERRVNIMARPTIPE